jgi:hydroxymethylpyrimidine/phosphomethylpyrimidine kinase
MANQLPVCLTVSGSDSCGGAGLQADMKIFTALGAYGASAITALTAQNTTGVKGVVAIDPAFVTLQIETVFGDLPVAAAKTGMLASAATIGAVAQAFAARPHCALVVDPVMVARGGDLLLEKNAIGAMCEQLLPLATVVTPNRYEAAILAGTGAITDAATLRHAARTIFESCGRPVLAKGGAALPGALDLLVDAEGEYPLTLAEGAIDTRSTHGTGCALSAALTVFLALGHPLREAAAEAKQFVAGAIRHAPGFGSGHGPVHHGWIVPLGTNVEGDANPGRPGTGLA